MAGMYPRAVCDVLRPFLRLVGEQDRAGILLEGGHEIDPLTTLGNTEGPAVDDAVCPPVPEFLEGSNDNFQSLPTCELEHERHVLQQDPRHAFAIQESKHVPNQPGIDATNSLGLAGLTQILTRKSSSQDPNTGRNRRQIPNVRVNGHSWEAGFQNCFRSGIYFT